MDIHDLLGNDADYLLNHTATAIAKENLVLPGPDFIDRVLLETDRTPTVLRNIGTMYNHGRLGGTGYLSILPVDQGIEHSGAASFAKVPKYFDPAQLCELAMAGDCSAIATTLGVLKAVSRRYVTKMPFIVKINHNDWLHYPNTYDQIMYSAWQGMIPLSLGMVVVASVLTYLGRTDTFTTLAANCLLTAVFLVALSMTRPKVPNSKIRLAGSRFNPLVGEVVQSRPTHVMAIADKPL
jgi:class I fructose-bisphosphate aldolase